MDLGTMTSFECGTQGPRTTLFSSLVDDAGLFPPTSLHMSEALARHQRDLDAGSPVLTHRFLCPSSRIDALRREPQQPRRIGLIVDTSEIPPFDDLPVDLVEVRLPPEQSVNAMAERLQGHLPPNAALFIEVPPTKLVPNMPQGVGLKVRCGGATPDAFPSVTQLAAFIGFCVAHDIRFKATAGLHHAVRHFDPSLAVDRHGFLNLVLAVCEAVEERDPAHVLGTTDVGELVRLARAVPEQTAKRARQLLVSYGSCSTSAPIDDLRTLGLDT
ncbi:hypothetical protein [Nonomuraea dietziae]|uniref:Uncharacterized protein n=1 Tax=Nonomuraea dietziae TaxID=65515 RepID=A0A7W5Y9Z5_9ACTN|nr:hypothetical protein [Nonomuraea dietziae]MBB3730263.1 hypothetical protein [Nonomuraea dietziae]